MKRGSVDHNALTKFLSKNPGASYKQFIRAGGQKISDVSYYQIRKKITGGMAVHGRVGSKAVASPAPVNRKAGNGNLLPPDFQIRAGFESKYKKLARFIMDNPNLGCTQTMKTLKLGMSDSSYYRFRDRMEAAGMLSGKEKGNGTPPAPSSADSPRSYVRKKSSVYMPVFSLPVNGMTELAKKTAMETLTAFTESLNTNKRGKYQVVEYANPKEIEVREYQ
jgi:hypothetical protein